ncbi:hypothetical protein EGS38_05520 [Neisseria chenwenguii]|nr:hypothetical protein EGS38_05520 [Neisseria chenwenguii]
MAALLGKAPQTINNDIKHGLVLQQVRQGKFEKIYRADRAQDIYETNRKNCRKPVSLTNGGYHMKLFLTSITRLLLFWIEDINKP